MSKLDNVNTGLCESYLAIWDENNEDNVLPSYDEDDKVWEFSFNNGETCGNQLESSFYVYWFCNQDIRAPSFRVKKAEEVAPCLYDLEIESDAAC